MCIRDSCNTEVAGFTLNPPTNCCPEICTITGGPEMCIRDSRDRGTVHRPCVPFACCDVGAGPVMVELEVTDAAGNVNYCMIEATIPVSYTHLDVYKRQPMMMLSQKVDVHKNIRLQGPGQPRMLVVTERIAHKLSPLMTVLRQPLPLVRRM